METSGVSGVFSFRSVAEAEAVLVAVVEAMDVAGYPAEDAFAVRLALDEAIVNAVQHGNQGDPRKRVRVRFDITAERVLAEVEDNGPGFDPAQVPDPRTPRHRVRPSGRGLFLMRQYMTSCRYNEQGNRVTLCKCRSAVGSPT
jgi:serine/threonine-protein kinase RsbW